MKNVIKDKKIDKLVNRKNNDNFAPFQPLNISFSYEFYKKIFFSLLQLKQLQNLK